MPQIRPAHLRCSALAGLCLFAACAVALSANVVAQSDPGPAKVPEATVTPARPDAKVDSVENSVVKVFTTARYPDLYQPWTKQSPTELTGSGIVIEGKRILTNAHVVLYASQVQVQANQAGDKISAAVEGIAPGIDLAVLKLEDESFFDSHHALARASALPGIKDAVMAYGYPKGGDTLSITKGIVSRIEFAPYTYPATGLRIQIDAAINPGNSGGPAVVGDQMIGLAFSHLGGAENIGYIIPNEEIDLFLRDVAHGHYEGKPAIFDEFQSLENPALRAFLKLDKSVSGLVVTAAWSTDTAYPLKAWDVIIKIADNVRVHFDYLVQKIAKDGKVPLTIVRAGKEIPIDLPVARSRATVIPGLEGTYPSYFVYGPLVVSNSTAEFLGGFTRAENAGYRMAYLSMVGNPLIRRMGDKPAFEEERLVVVSSPLFSQKLASGYGNPIGRVVKSLNGIPLKNLAHLVQLLRDSKDEFITFEFAGRQTETLVFRRAEVEAATDEVLRDNGLRSQGSADVLAVWKAGSSR
jgi:S1-C subfamily serine protease